MSGAPLSQASFLNKFARVSSNSQEWSRLEYFLQISLGSSTAVIKNIWSIANPNMTMNFEKKNKVNIHSFLLRAKYHISLS